MIVLPPGLFDLSADTTPLEVHDDLTIIGAGSNATTIDGGASHSVFRLTDDATLDLGWLAIHNDSQTSVEIEAGSLAEIADLDIQEIARQERPDTPIANLNDSANVDSGVLSSGRRHTELVRSLFALPTQTAVRNELLITRQPIITQLSPPLDATLGIANPQPVAPLTASRPDAPSPSRIARTENSPESGSDSVTNRRRDDVVNSLFRTNDPKVSEEIRPTGAIGLPEQQHEPEHQSAASGSSDALVIPEALELPQQPSNADTGLPDDLPPSGFEEPLPLFPNLDTPAIEFELPDIKNAAPLLPVLESELPAIRVDEPAIRVEESEPATRRSSLLPAGLSGLLTSALTYRSLRSRRTSHDRQLSRQLQDDR